MSDRFYTTLHVIGPNEMSAEKAAIEALKAIQSGGRWFENCPPHFFDHNSGDAAIDALKPLSLKFPSEMFLLDVAGGCGEGIQGYVAIANGAVKDARSEDIAYGVVPVNSAANASGKVPRSLLLLLWLLIENADVDERTAQEA